MSQQSPASEERLPADCEAAANIQLRLLENDAVSSDERATLERHAAGCAQCRALFSSMQSSDSTLRGAFQSARVSDGFAARVMLALPAAPAASASGARRATETSPRVFTTARPSIFTPARIAAALVLAAIGIATAIVFVAQEPALAAAVKKGTISDANGKTVSALQVNKPYVAKETAVLALAESVLVKVQQGAEFQLEQADQPHLKLRSGDVYASTGRSTGPVMVACTYFDTELHGGDFFVAQENSPAARGIVIVFSGNARVQMPQKEAVPVGAGEVFFSIGAEGMPMAAADLPRKRQQAAVSEKDPQSRELYASKVTSYSQELADLKKALASAPQESRQYADLSDRCRRVSEYLDAHQRKLKSLTPDNSLQQIPFEQIERGINGRTESASWL
jgi:hypothetical protein